MARWTALVLLGLATLLATATAQTFSCAKDGCRFFEPDTFADSFASCQCDEACVEHNDCCSDYADVCVRAPKDTAADAGDAKANSVVVELPTTCAAKGCGRPGFGHGHSCQCDSYCALHGDCCDDYDEVCASAPVECPSIKCECLDGSPATWSLDAAGCPTCTCSRGEIAEVSDNAGSNVRGNPSAVSVPLIAGVAAGVVLVAVVTLVVLRRVRARPDGSQYNSSANSAGSSELTWDDFDVVGSETNSQQGGSSYSIDCPQEHTALPVRDGPSSKLSGRALSDMEGLHAQFLEMESQGGADFWVVEPDTSGCNTFALHEKPNAFNSSEA